MYSSFTYKSQKLEISEDILQQNNPESTVICLPSAEDSYFVIDGFANEIWKRLNQGQAVDAAIKALVETHKIHVEVITPEVEKMIEDLLEFKIIKKADS